MSPRKFTCRESVQTTNCTSILRIDRTVNSVRCLSNLMSCGRSSKYRTPEKNWKIGAPHSVLQNLRQKQTYRAIPPRCARTNESKRLGGKKRLRLSLNPLAGTRVLGRQFRSAGTLFKPVEMFWCSRLRIWTTGPQTFPE